MLADDAFYEYSFISSLNACDRELGNCAIAGIEL
jgi:hypothetical protein